MAEKDTKDVDPNDPKNQVASQTTPEDAAPGEPGYYSPPDPHFGVTKSAPNEVLTDKMIEEAEKIPDNRSAWDKKQAGVTKEGKGKTDTGTETDYEAMTVPELKELAHQRGVEIHSDMLKDDIIQALKKA
jgi:Rho termination factor, N-terminal domain